MGWPAADGTPWTWTWTAYPAVWLLLVAALGGYVGLIAWLRRRPNATIDVTSSRMKTLAFAAGVLVTWLALDWPLGALAANLFWVRTAQYLVLTLVAAPLLLLGTPPIPVPPIRAPRWLSALGRFVTRPLIAAVIFSVTLFISHVPAVVDAIEPDPVAAAALRAGWLATALIYWWPLVGPGPARNRLRYLGSVVYLILPFLLPKMPGVLYVFATAPIHAAYDHDGRPWGLTPMEDQGVAGFLLWIIGSVMVLIAVYVVFRRWGEQDHELRRPASLATPADPNAIAILLAVPGAWRAFEQLLAIVEDSLPAGAGTTGPRTASLAFRIRRRRTDHGWREQAVLIVQLSGTERERDLLDTRIAAQFAAHMAEHTEAHRHAVRDCLDVEVERLGVRVV